MKQNPIILIDDDDDDCVLFKEACAELNITNEIVVFHDSDKAFNYFRSMATQPFFIICEVNIPEIGGLELRQKLNEDEELRLKAVPFLFWSTSGSESLVNKGFTLNIQGFFKKPNSMEELKKIITAITIYWDCSYHPIK